MQPDLPNVAEMVKSYQAMQQQHEAERAARVIASNRERDVQMVSEWRATAEDLAKFETMLSTAIANEKKLIGTEGMGWPARLDQMLGEISRYRDTLMRRISDKAVERLTPPRTDDDIKGIDDLINKFGR